MPEASFEMPSNVIGYNQTNGTMTLFKGQSQSVLTQITLRCWGSAAQPKLEAWPENTCMVDNFPCI